MVASRRRCHLRAVPKLSTRRWCSKGWWSRDLCSQQASKLSPSCSLISNSSCRSHRCSLIQQPKCHYKIFNKSRCSSSNKTKLVNKLTLKISHQFTSSFKSSWSNYYRLNSSTLMPFHQRALCLCPLLALIASDSRNRCLAVPYPSPNHRWWAVRSCLKWPHRTLCSAAARRLNTR